MENNDKKYTVSELGSIPSKITSLACYGLYKMNKSILHSIEIYYIDFF